jgi:hypothetical protein
LDPLGQVRTPDVDVTLENPERDGETIKTTDPEFFGLGPAGASLEIIVESSKPTAATVTIPQSGRWTFSLLRGLTVGEHQITLKWKDAQGTIQTLTRSFVVYATTDAPAFTATESATPTLALPTPTPTPSEAPSPTVVPTVTPAATATPSPVPTTVRTSLPPETAPPPESGSLTPTLALLIMGGASLFVGLTVMRRSAPHG